MELRDVRRVAHPPENDNEQKLIGDYSILKLLGKGWFGKVYLAECKTTKKECAIKEIEIGEDTSEDDATKEASLLRESQHDYVLILYYSRFEDDRFYIITEYCPNGTLENLISKGISPEDYERFTLQLCAVLGHLHEKGIVHYDLKPNNILIGNNGCLKLADFGNADRLGSPELTKYGTLVYTGGDLALVKGDMKDFARVLYLMLHGPFESENQIDEEINKFKEKSIPWSCENNGDNLANRDYVINLLLREEHGKILNIPVNTKSSDRRL